MWARDDAGARVTILTTILFMNDSDFSTVYILIPTGLYQLRFYISKDVHPNSIWAYQFCIVTLNIE